MDVIPTAALASQVGPGNPIPPVKIDNKVRSDWNSYVQWLDSKGLKGHPSLDHNDLGFKMIDEYRKENPGTSISKDMVIPIQQEFANYRNYALKQVDNGQLILGKGVTKDNYLRSLSTVDGIPGQRTTSFSFPSGYMKDMNTGEVKNKGFINTEKPVSDQLTSSN